MKRLFVRLSTAAMTAASAYFLSSCSYDPYGASYGGYYGSSFDGGGTSFAAAFVSTGDSRWAYDPYRYCYYDYTRRAYYDPYLYGYYPVGYLPPRLYGVPHPYGWRPGRGYCPPPRNVRFHALSNYQNRVNLLRRQNHSWARNVRMGSDRNFGPGRVPRNLERYRPGNRPNSRPNFLNRPNSPNQSGFNRPDRPGRPGFQNRGDRRDGPGFMNRPGVPNRTPQTRSDNRFSNSPRPQFDPQRRSGPPRVSRDSFINRRGGSPSFSNRSSSSPSRPSVSGRGGQQVRPTPPQRSQPQHSSQRNDRRDGHRGRR